MTLTTQKRTREIAARRFGERGFALVEILVAFLILALGLGAVLIGVSGAMHSDASTQASRRTLRVAQSRLESAGVTERLVPGRSEGRVGNTFSWRQTVTAIQYGAGFRKPKDAKIEPPSINAVTALWVEVVVRAGDGTVAKLAGLKLASESRP